MSKFKCTVGNFARGLAVFSFASVLLSFVTPYWLKCDKRYYGGVFLRMGLWETCFRSFHDPYDVKLRKYYAGCRWILTHEYNTLRGFIEQRK
ncbi:hypothetical protein JTE90_014583 [Oedothorax gibbosus]|uniref:Uncharacterized protein n=1 Tax=Oedothorax gibbosus TaxID=931172 RepID=A0AAV6UNC8_9ARAC|nr:hypothetical protein JTE90_014583 [Oedothorax gibbosus]